MELRPDLLAAQARLADPDQDVRDDAWRALRGADLGDAALRHDLGGSALGRLGSPHLLVRVAGARTLDVVARGGTWDEVWTEPVLRWWTREEDLRCADPDLGRLDALGHGADLLTTLADTDAAPPLRLLGACARRVVAPTEFLWADGEDQRIARAGTAALGGVGPGTDPCAWLGPLRSLVAGPPVIGDPSRANTVHTLAALHHLLTSARLAAAAPGHPSGSTPGAHVARIAAPVRAAVVAAVDELLGATL